MKPWSHFANTTLSAAANAATQEKDYVYGEVLCGGRHEAIIRQVREEGCNLSRTQRAQVFLVAEEDKTANPLGVRFLGAGGVAQAATRMTNGL